MNEITDKTLESEQSFEELLGRASPRPMPSDDDTRIVRGAVEAEWQAVTRQRMRRRRFVSLAAAATILLALAIVINVVQVPTVQPVQVAAIDRSIGSIYVLGAQSELEPTDDLSSISAGQTIVTGADSGLGLEWGAGGSLRVGEDSKITFVATGEIELVSGAVYFDSIGMPENETLLVRTGHGDVTHVGTRYIVMSGQDELTVSVRDGRVVVDGLHHDATVEEGQRVDLVGSAMPAVLNISAYGDDWAWVEATAPTKSFDGELVLTLLEWVAYETGLELRIDGPTAVRVVNDFHLIGDYDSEPRVALRQGLTAAGLKFRIEDGVIIITD